MRFIADVMLGRLARWLRIAGHDVSYSNDASDEELARATREEERILLTRDTRLVQRRAVRRYLLVNSDHLPEQLAQVFHQYALHLDADRFFTRCSLCNTELVEVTREEVREEVPCYVYRTHERFGRCPVCERVYWEGTHRNRALRFIRGALHHRG